MSEELRILAEQLVSYYRQHGVGNMIKSHPSFVEDDFTKLLNLLEKEQ